MERRRKTSLNCLIFGAAPIEQYDYIRPYLDLQHKIVIAADGGLRHTAALGLIPDVIIGDMDSFREKDVPAGAILFPTRKDDTDMMLAIKKGLAMGAEEFFLFGGMGGRFDHTYANIQSLAYLLQFGKRGWLLDENHKICLLTEGSLTLSPEYKYLSVFAYGGTCSGITITGAEYNLDDAVLEPDFPLGVSNQHAAGQTMRVSVQNGTLLIIQTKIS